MLIVYSFILPMLVAECPGMYLQVRHGSDGLGGESIARIGLMAYARVSGFGY